MKLSDPKLWVVVFSIAAVALMAVGDLALEAPGELTRVHARQSALSGLGSCSNCHGGWTSDMTSSCLDCHEAIDAQLEVGAGLHGHLGRDHVAQCSVCHSEHHGADFAIVNDRSFAIAGVPDRLAFDHGRIGFGMGGAHLDEDCSTCHRHAETPQLEDGTHRYLGLDRNCATCHDDAHRGAYRALACADCHGQSDFLVLEPRDHDRFLTLEGPHAEATCTDCHPAGDERSLEAIGRGTAPRKGRGCADCHHSPHQTLGDPRAQPADSCADCHDPLDHLGFDAAALQRLDAVTHARFGFRLDAPHDAAACTDCHAPDLGFVERHPGRDQDDCAACHRDPHAGQFADSPFGRMGCIGCHAPTHFAPHGFGIDSHHAHAGLALAGSHREVACEDCHPRTEPRDVHEDGSPRAFRGAGADCGRCHGDAHRGAFDPHAAALRQGDPQAGRHGTCAACHQPTRFAELRPDSFEHGRHAGFALDGAHAQDGCAICHPQSAEPDELGRRFGIVEDHFGAFTAGCASCHADPHGGVFDGSDRDHPATVAGRTDCARCHDTTSFRALPHGFDHGSWTGFALDGVHGDAGCTDCHTPLAEPDPATGRTLAPAAPGGACADCHADPHAGQFAGHAPRPANPPADCRRCHTTELPQEGAAAFRAARFDHETDARFPLGEAHGSLACSRCHQSDDDGGEQVIRYRPIPHACADCHGRRDNPLRRRRGGGR